MSSILLGLQAPGGVLTSSVLRRVTDPISVVPNASARLRHFFDGVYDLSPESHLSRFVKVLLGDSGVGYLDKVYLYARSQSVLATMRFADLDAFYGDVLGLKRMSWERTDPARYYRANTPEEWDEIDARDASYRARIEAFSRAINHGGTPEGLRGIAEALLGVECRIYESYLLIDEGGIDTSPGTPLAGRTYGGIETEFARYGDLDRKTYADIEGGFGTIGRSDVNDRSHFTIRPMRTLSSEEHYIATKVLERFKPVGTLLSLDPAGVALHSLAKIRGVTADSTHWEIVTSVTPPPAKRQLYTPPNASVDPVLEDERPYQETFDLTRPALSGYQGEVWSYNSDVIRVTGYREIAKSLWPILPDPDDYEQRISPPPGFQPHGYVQGLKTNFQRVQYPSGPRDYRPEKALADHTVLLQGRAASDGVAAASPVIQASSVSDQVRLTEQPVLTRSM